MLGRCLIVKENSELVKGKPTLASKCDICGKSLQFGHNVSHSKRRTNRSWSSNVHKATIIVDGKPVRANVCTRCLRSQYKIART